MKFSTVGEPLQLTKSSCFSSLLHHSWKTKISEYLEIWFSSICCFPVNLCPWIPLAAYYETTCYILAFLLLLLFYLQLGLHSLSQIFTIKHTTVLSLLSSLLSTYLLWPLFFYCQLICYDFRFFTSGLSLLEGLGKCFTGCSWRVACSVHGLPAPIDVQSQCLRKIKKYLNRHRRSVSTTISELSNKKWDFWSANTAKYPSFTEIQTHNPFHYWESLPKTMRQ